MKAKLKVSTHLILPGESIIEVWFNNELIGQVTGADGPGIRFISKHPTVVNARQPCITELVTITKPR